MSLANVRRQTMRLVVRRYSSSGATASAAIVPQVLGSNDFPNLITPERRLRCMEQLRGLPPFGPSKAPQTKREQATASVLIALCIESGTNEISLLYTRRSRHLRRHSLQISFPGGIRDPTDDSFVNCALRETEEEIGLPRDRIDVWGEGTLMHFPRAAAIMPVVGVVQDFNISQLKLNWEEVEEALSIPLTTLLAPNVTRHTQFRGAYSIPAFVVDRNRIWGITAYLTYVFLRCLMPATVLPEALKTNIKFIRPYKLPPKPHHHQHTEQAAEQKEQTQN